METCYEKCRTGFHNMFICIEWRSGYEEKSLHLNPFPVVSLFVTPVSVRFAQECVINYFSEHNLILHTNICLYFNYLRSSPRITLFFSSQKCSFKHGINLKKELMGNYGNCFQKSSAFFSSSSGLEEQFITWNRKIVVYSCSRTEKEMCIREWQH